MIRPHRRSAARPGLSLASMGIRARRAAPGTPQFCTHPGTNPYFFIEIRGGPTNATSYRRWYLFSTPLLINHWYDVVVHVYWLSSSTAGWFQARLDPASNPTPVLDVHTPTLYTPPERNPLLRREHRVPQLPSLGQPPLEHRL
jgi:hypothetical protein